MRREFINRDESKEYIDSEVAQEYQLILTSLLNELDDYCVVTIYEYEHTGPFSREEVMEAIFPLPTTEAWNKLMRRYNVEYTSLREQFKDIKMKSAAKDIRIRDNLSRLLEEIGYKLHIGSDDDPSDGPFGRLLRNGINPMRNGVDASFGPPTWSSS